MRRRPTTAAVWLLLALIGIGPAITGVARGPEETQVDAESDWRMVDHREIAVDGQPVALSPDGRWLAGIGPDDGSVCVWDVDTLTPTCAEEEVRFWPWPMAPSMVWAPDSSAVAFVDGFFYLAETHNVAVFDVASADLTYLTDSSGESEAPLHLGMAWTADSQDVVVARTQSVSPNVVIIDRDGGNVRVIPLPEEWSSGYLIQLPFFVTADATLIFQIDGGTDSLNRIGVWTIGLDGSNPVRLLAAGEQTPIDDPVTVGVSADGEYASVVSATALDDRVFENAFYVVDVNTGEVEHMEVNGKRNVLGQPVFSPTAPVALIFGGESPETLLHVMNLDTGESHALAGSRNVLHLTQFQWWVKPPTWAGNETVFVPTNDGGVLLTLEHTP